MLKSIFQKKERKSIKLKNNSFVIQNAEQLPASKTENKAHRKSNSVLEPSWDVITANEVREFKRDFKVELIPEASNSENESQSIMEQLQKQNEILMKENADLRAQNEKLKSEQAKSNDSILENTRNLQKQNILELNKTYISKIVDLEKTVSDQKLEINSLKNRLKEYENCAQTIIKKSQIAPL